MVDENDYNTVANIEMMTTVNLFHFFACFQSEAVQLLVDGRAQKMPQPSEGATYEPIMKKDLAQVMPSSTNSEPFES